VVTQNIPMVMHVSGGIWRGTSRVDGWRKVLNTSFYWDGRAAPRVLCRRALAFIIFCSHTCCSLSRWIHLALAQILLEIDNGNHIVFLCTSVLSLFFLEQTPEHHEPESVPPCTILQVLSRALTLWLAYFCAPCTAISPFTGFLFSEAVAGCALVYFVVHHSLSLQVRRLVHLVAHRHGQCPKVGRTLSFLPKGG
jgi:hypothetical protein